MKNYESNDNDKSLEREFIKAVKMLGESQTRAKDKQIINTDLQEANVNLRLKILDLKEEIVSLRDENTALKEENKKLKGETQQIDLSERDNLFFATGIKTPVCYNCSIEKGRPFILGKKIGILYECSACNEQSFYHPKTTDTKEKSTYLDS